MGHRERKHGLLELMTGQLFWWVALPMAAVWFAAAFMYYGQVLIVADMFAAEESGERCEYTVAEPEPEPEGQCPELGAKDVR
eukprot:COSAG01_NODE_2275_length_8019_cov_79.308838_5_plen_82_part_00